MQQRLAFVCEVCPVRLLDRGSDLCSGAKCRRGLKLNLDISVVPSCTGTTFLLLPCVGDRMWAGNYGNTMCGGVEKLCLLTIALICCTIEH